MQERSACFYIWVHFKEPWMAKISTESYTTKFLLIVSRFWHVKHNNLALEGLKWKNMEIGMKPTGCVGLAH